MDDGSPTLEVGFAIETGGSFDELMRLQSMMETTEMRVVTEAKKIEKATGGMVNVASATAAITSFGNAATRELRSAAAEASRVEKSGERMVVQLERQNAAFGKTRDELRAMRVEEQALAAERTGNSDLAARLRAAEQTGWDLQYSAMRKAQLATDALAQDRDAAAARAILDAAKEATAIRDAGIAHQQFEARVRQGVVALREEEVQARKTAAAVDAIQTERLADEQARLVATVRGSQAAQEADAAAAERLRAATDPLYAATKRLNAELAESERLYRVGATLQPEYARQQEVLTGRVRALGAQHEEAAGKIGKSNFALKQTAIQIPDIVQGLLTGQKPMTVFIQQGGQIAQIAQMAEGGIKGFAMQLGGLLLRFTPLIAATAVAGVALYRWKQEINDDAGLKKFADGLGLSHKEMKKLGDVSLTTGDLVAGVWKTITDGTGTGGGGKKLLDYLFSPDDAKQVQTFVSQIYGVFVGGYSAIVELWGQIAPAVTGFISRAAAAAAAFFKPLIDAAQWAAGGISSVFSAIYDWVADRVRAMGQWIAPILQAIGLDKAAAAMSSAGSKLGATFGAAYTKASQQFVTGTNAFVAKAAENAVTHAQDRLTKKATEIKADRTPKVDRHAEQLAREAEATEAQIRNLYKLADAYRVSDAAALIAEARVKAESKAIKQRGDIEAEVDRQLRLSIAQRVADGERAADNLRAQAGVQEGVNAAVEAGLVPAARAAEILRDRVALLPLQAALEAAVLDGQVGHAALAGKAIMDLTAAQERDNAARREAQYLADKQAGSDQLDQLRLEAQLINAAAAARVHALATLKATQEATARGGTSQQQQDYIRQHVAVADAQQKGVEREAQFNEQLRITAELANSVGDSLRDAFGKGGAALGGMIKILGEYGARQEDIAKQVRKGQISEAAGAKLAGDLQMSSMIGLASAAKGFFKEHSKGYEAMAAAEKALAIVQLARTAVSVAAGAAQMFAELGPFAFPAVAAMVGVMASLGFSGRSGVSKADYTKGNTGTGTVLGDPDAKSASIKNAIDTLKAVDDATLTVSRDMLTSLKAIESNIGGLASLLVRTGNIDASAGVSTGFKSNALGGALSFVAGGGALGSLLKKVPVIGDILGGISSLVKSLFGTKTSVVGSGLYGAPQQLGDILNGAFDLQTYSDIQKKKKFFGITTGTSYSTQYGQADSSIDDQFTLVLKSFYEAIGKSAPLLGQATSDVEDRLNSFVFSLGKVQLDGKTGTEIQELLENALGAAADNMAQAAVPGLERFEKVGEGYFETLVRVATTVEQVDATFQKLGKTTTSLGLDVDMAIAGMFDNVSDFTSLASTYFSDYYSKAEQAAAQTAQFTRAFAGLGLAMPDTLAGFRQLVEAQDLTTDAGRDTYVTLLKLAPAFSDLKTSMEGAKSAADILSEQQDLQAKLLQLTGDTAAIRAAELAKLDPSNRALQEQIYAIQDAQDAAKAASDLRDAWKSVGDTIMDEVRRIRGLADTPGAGFASLMGQFNAATAAARAGDQDMAKSLPGISQALLAAAKDAATSRQEYDRVQAQTAASLEATFNAVTALAGNPTSTLDAAAALTSAQGGTPANDQADTSDEIAAMRAEMADMKQQLMTALTTIAANTGRTAKKLDDVTGESGGNSVAVTIAA